MRDPISMERTLTYVISAGIIGLGVWILIAGPSSKTPALWACTSLIPIAIGLLAFEARNVRQTSELSKEGWLSADLSVLASNGIPLCTAAAELSVRRATESEMQIYRDADREAQASGDPSPAYLIEFDGSGPRTRTLPTDYSPISTARPTDAALFFPL